MKKFMDRQAVRVSEYIGIVLKISLILLYSLSIARLCYC